jgi:hypothetical protein
MVRETTCDLQETGGDGINKNYLVKNFPFAESCEQGNDPPSQEMNGEYLDYLRDHKLLKNCYSPLSRC